MIPRTARARLESSLSHYARQALPRPARYSTPSKRVNAPALATATAPSPDFPAFMNVSPPAPPPITDVLSEANDLENFLRRQKTLTVLPTPLPEDNASPMAALNLSDSATLDQLAAINACLHNLHDVPRGKEIFDRLRATHLGDPALNPKLYSMVLKTYLQMAEKDAAEGRGSMWLEELALLFDSMYNGTEQITPAPGSYAVMLLAWHKFNPDSWSSSTRINLKSPKDILNRIVSEGIAVADVVSDRAIESSETATEIMKLLSRAAADLRLSHIVSELGQVQALGSTLEGDAAVADPLVGVPEAMPVQKQVTGEDGTAQMEVPFNIEVLRRHLGQASLARNALSDDIAARQKLLEQSVYDLAKERLQRDKDQMAALDMGPRLQHADLQKWMWEWHSALRDKLKADIETIIEEENSWTDLSKDRMGAFLRLIKPEKLSLITITEIMRLSGTGGIADGMKTARSLLSVGKAVELEYKAEMCKKNGLQIPAMANRASEHGYFSRMGYRDLHARRVAAAKYINDAEDWTAEWSQVLRIKVGSFLVDNLMNLATVKRTAIDKRTGEEVSQDQPAFFHSYEYNKGHKLGVIKLNPVIAERLAKDAPGGIHPRHLPMLMKPKPWVAFDQGGYIYNKSNVMRFKESIEQKAYLAHADKLGNLELVYAGLDVLGSTPWKVNRDVFDVVLKVWNSGERLGKIPPAVFDGVEPTKPEEGADPQVRSNYLMKQKAYIQNKAANHSDRCSVNYKIEISRSFLGDTFYFPHNLDFRGRAYPIPPHLNHIGDDLSRGLLLFAESKPLGERGLRWLKIHCANLAGCDKGDFEERVAFVHEHLDDIYDSAERPLEGRRWWQQSDDPWQCLATCIELRNALESPDPLKYESSLPVHQDGTCNGLQHYAALGGDSQGAKQVNLAVTDRPSDVYTYVANMVEAQLEQDILKTDNKWAKLLKGRIARKVVKQTVMTTVYGVTFIGAREQIERQLAARGELPEEECWEAAAYLAKKVLGCIGDLFRGAKDIQTWLNIVARMVSKSIPPERLEHALKAEPRKRTRSSPGTLASRLNKEQMTSMIWTTPLGLPIVQPYRKTKRRQVYTSLQSVYISDPNLPSSVNAMKQASAFPPNFIHSLDATHMMLTALECRTAGLSFASVHDSYWTHASSIDEMSTIIRDTFIKLHKSDVLKNLETELRERYKGYKVPLLALKTSSTVMKHLAAYEGSTITAKGLAAAVANAVDKAEATAIPAEELAVLSNENAEATEGEAVAAAEGAESSVKQLVAKAKRGRKPKSETEVEASAEAGTDPNRAAIMKKLDEQFVDLLDLIPPLPNKGDFDVDAIRGSAYFFS